MLDGNPAPLPKKGARPPIFGPCLLRPNGWIDQDVTWCGSRPRPRPYCDRWGPAPPPQEKGDTAPPIFGPCLLWSNGWMDQDANWYEGRSRPDRNVLHVDPAPSKRSIAPNFRPMSIVAKRSPILASAEHLLLFIVLILVTFTLYDRH